MRPRHEAAVEVPPAPTDRYPHAMRPVHLALVLTLGCGGATASAPTTVASNHRTEDDSVELRFAPPIGMRYAEDVSMEFTIGGSGFTAHVVSENVVLGRSGDVTDIETRTVSAVMRRDGAETPVPGMTSDPRRQRVDARGGRAGMDPTDAIDGARFFYLPTGPVRVGDRWPFLLPEGHPLRGDGDFSCELVALEDGPTGRVARLRAWNLISAEAGNEPERGSGDHVTLEATVDVATGLLLELTLHGESRAVSLGAGPAVAPRLDLHIVTTVR